MAYEALLIFRMLLPESLFGNDPPRITAPKVPMRLMDGDSQRRLRPVCSVGFVFMTSPHAPS
jgi:hypothetical protein